MSEGLNGYGPPAGAVTLDELARRYAAPFDDASKDPAFAAPVDATDADTKSRAKLVYRDLPLVTIQNTWSVDQARGALYAHMQGIFDASGQLCDALLGDDRVTATLNSRATALFGREVRFKSADDSDAARECLDAWVAWWPRFAGDAGLRELHDYATMMGFAPSQLVWDTSRPVWGPYLRPWHNRYTYFDWPSRHYMAMSQDGTIPIVPGDGKWVLHAPFGDPSPSRGCSATSASVTWLALLRSTASLPALAKYPPSPIRSSARSLRRRSHRSVPRPA